MVPTLLVLAEFDVGGHLEEIVGAVRGYAGDVARLVVLRTPRGRIPLTSSGKPRRRAAWQQYLAGTLSGEVLLATQPAPVPLGVAG